MGPMPLGREINSFLWQSNKYLYIALPKDLHQKGLRGSCVCRKEKGAILLLPLQPEDTDRQRGRACSYHI